MYLCETGRWLSKDIIEDIVEQIGAINPDGLMMAAYSKVIRGGADINLYAYCANDSLNSFDMLGLACTFVRYTQSVPWGGNAGIARTSGTIDYRNEVKICDKLCSPCETGKSIKQMSTIRVTGTAAFQLPIPLPPLVRIEFTFGIIGGGQFEHEVDACTGKTTSKGCAFYTVLAGLQGCAGSRYLGGEICLRGEGDLTHRWCADGTQETCMGAKVMMRTCFFSRCYDVIFFETPRKCW